MIIKIAVLVTALALVPLVGLFAQEEDTSTQNTPPAVQNASPAVQNASPAVQNASPAAQNASPPAQNASPPAQKANPTAQGTGFQIFSFDLIYGTLTDVTDFSGDIAITPAFGLNFRFAPGFIVGFETSPASFNGFNLKYDLSESLRAAIYLGQTGPTGSTVSTAGLGMEITIFSAQTALATNFRLGARYTFPVSTPDKGFIGINLILGLGV
jgi:hypothetical protein